MIDADRGCGPGQRAHGMACLERGLDRRKTNSFACTDDQNGRHWREYFLRVPARERGRSACLNVSISSDRDQRAFERMLLDHAIVIQIEGSSYRLRQHVSAASLHSQLVDSTP